MTEVQRLFDKGYTPASAHSLTRTGGSTIDGRRPHPAPRIVPSAAWLAAGLVLGIVAAGVAAAAPLAPSPWDQYDTGRVSVVFPEQLPVVELVQDANASVSATLQLTGIYELSSGPLSNATIVAAAFPAQAASFNGTASPAPGAAPVALTAQLAAFPVRAQVWQTGGFLAPLGGALGQTTLSVSYSDTTTTTNGAGVAINWSLSSWPWVAPHDYLALSLAFGYAANGALTACTATSLLYHAAPPCVGSDVPNGSALWGAGFSSVEGEGGGGPVAAVSWGSSVAFGASTSPVTVGALANGTGKGDLLLSAPEAATGTGASGTVAFALVAPVPPAVVATLLHGSALVYGGAAAAAALVSVAGVLAYRRHDRRVRDEL